MRFKSMFLLTTKERDLIEKLQDVSVTISARKLILIKTKEKNSALNLQTKSTIHCLDFQKNQGRKKLDK